MRVVEKILLVRGELADLHAMCGRGYIAVAPERVARILDALDAGAWAAEQAEALAAELRRVKAERR